jgi:hypothetical protein
MIAAASISRPFCLVSRIPGLEKPAFAAHKRHSHFLLSGRWPEASMILVKAIYRRTKA